MKVLVRLILFCTVQGMTPSVHIRAFTADDVPAIASIYSHDVLTGTATFEEIPPDEGEMATRLSGLVSRVSVLVACGALARSWAMPMPARIRPGRLTGSLWKIRFIFIKTITAQVSAGRCCLLLSQPVRTGGINRFWL